MQGQNTEGRDRSCEGLGNEGSGGTKEGKDGEVRMGLHTPVEYAPSPWSPVGPSRTISPSV